MTKINNTISYPEYVFFAKDEQVLSLTTEEAFKFRLLRKVLNQCWNLQHDVSKISFEFGREDSPICLDNENFKLSDLEIITVLLSHRDYTQIKSITKEQ
jgi:hypothetical protein